MKITIEIKWKKEPEAAQPNPGMPNMPAKPSLQMPSPTPTDDMPWRNYNIPSGYW